MKIKHYVLIRLTPFGAQVSEHDTMPDLFEKLNHSEQFIVSITIYPVYEQISKEEQK